MKLTSRLLLCALITLMLSALAFAQTRRLENDPRNISPSVGTGGPEGGPTGLFTIYDGQTLRKGEFMFSIAYSNFDRDPGDVDISDIPVSFNIGLNDYIELFFKTNAHRKVKVNSPGNLSSFYLPNVTTFGVSGPAIVLAPTGPTIGTLTGLTLFRPAGNQPLVAYPFTGGSAGTFGQGPGAAGTLFGFPGFTATLGPPTGSLFPGVGSPVGSILPGVVLATTTLPPTALTTPITVPSSFSVLPSYLPDAPFIGTTDGSSSFTNFVFGGKIRFTKPNSAFGAGIIPFYRLWADKPNGNFAALQQGAGPGGRGDFGIIGFVDGRLSRSVNVSANVGYIVNSSAKDGSAVLLDRPNEFLAGLGLDFPINKHVQPIFELKSVHYVGSRTPNAFNNNPVDVLAGVKIYATRSVGVGVWGRYHLNQQSSGSFNPVDSNTQIVQLSGVNVPGRGIVIVPGTTVAATATGLPLGFRFSDNPFGFGFQFFAGKQHTREPAILPNQPPTASLAASTSTITLPCPPGTRSDTCPATANTTVGLATAASDPDGDTLLYSYTVTGGRITGEGANVSWDLSGVGPGTYTASVEVDDGCGCITQSSTTVTVAACPNCVAPPQPTPQATPMPTPEPTPLPPPANRKFDEYGNIRFNDEKARLDNFAIQLQNEPSAQGYIIGYGGCGAEGQTRANRAKGYLVNTRGIDGGRLVVVDGGCLPELMVQLWVVPQGAAAPTGDATGVVSPCPDCKKKPARRRGGRRRGEE